MPLRSILFAPGNQPRKLARAFALPADAVCLDLEDAVAAGEKDAARAAVAASMCEPRAIPCYVRVNPIDSPHCFADLDAVVRPGLAGIILPMVESASGLLTIDWLLRQLEARCRLAAGAIDLIPVIETARGVVRLAEICEAPSRVRRISFGSWDYTLDTGITYTPADEAVIDDARQRIVLHARSAGLAAPVDTSYPAIGDIDGLRRSCARARALGFGGKACIHPEQVAVVNELFSVGAAELEQAQRIVAAFEQAEAAGQAAIKVDGQFVDYPIYRKAKALVAASVAGR